MTSPSVTPTDDEDTTDGRSLRRRHNIEAVLDATMDLLAATGVPPTPEQVAERSGVSVSSIYRYFDNPTEMYEQAAERRIAAVQHLAAIDNLGEGTLDQRIDRFVANRLTLFELAGPVGRVWNRLAHRNPSVVERRAWILAVLRAQTEAHFATELEQMDPGERLMVLTTIDAMFQVSTVDHIVDVLGLELPAAAEVVGLLLQRLLGTTSDHAPTGLA